MSESIRLAIEELEQEQQKIGNVISILRGMSYGQQVVARRGRPQGSSRTMSASARRKISLAAKARWARFHATKKKAA